MANAGAPGDKPIYLNMEYSPAERAKDLVARMTLDERVSQMCNDAPAIERLGVPKYDWWNECLHGVARAGIATVFPQAIGLAATWDAPLMKKTAQTIADEARAKHHEAARQGKRNIYQGLTFWTPNINIFRDPRWGRGQETYGECPYLTARLGVAFVEGLQGDHPRYLKAAACAKHFAVHSGPEAERHGFDARVDGYDLWDTYLPAFKALVKEAKVESVMGAYNRVNGEACCASKTLLADVLRGEWGFRGHVVSDCGAVCDIWKHHGVATHPDEAAAMAVEAGCDLNCGNTYQYLSSAVAKGLISEETVSRSVERLFETRMRLGLFDPDESVPFAAIPAGANDTAQNRTLALTVARKSMTLLKNDGLLPLAKTLKRVAVIGPNADYVDSLLGNYNGTPSSFTTPLEAIRRKLPYSEVLYHKGCTHAGCDDDISDAVKLAAGCDVAILVLGLSPRIEGEEGDSQGDRVSLALPGRQEELLRAIHATGVPVALVLLSGSAIAVTWAAGNVPAILQAWYPGEEGGTAVADVLFGDYNPAGRLPVTFYKSEDDLPDFTEYSMEGRTYRYFKGDALYPFGWGLSYTKFEYGPVALSAGAVTVGSDVSVEATVTNAGRVAGEEVVQLYLSYRPRENSDVKAPIRSLRGFARVFLAPGESTKVVFTLSPQDMSIMDKEGRRWAMPGEWLVSVGGCQPLPVWESLGNACSKASVTVTGSPLEIER